MIIARPSAARPRTQSLHPSMPEYEAVLQQLDASGAVVSLDSFIVRWHYEPPQQQYELPPGVSGISTPPLPFIGPSPSTYDVWQAFNAEVIRILGPWSPLPLRPISVPYTNFEVRAYPDAEAFLIVFDERVAPLLLPAREQLRSFLQALDWVAAVEDHIAHPLPSMQCDPTRDCYGPHGDCQWLDVMRVTGLACASSRRHNDIYFSEFFFDPKFGAVDGLQEQGLLEVYNLGSPGEPSPNVHGYNHGNLTLAYAVGVRCIYGPGKNSKAKAYMFPWEAVDGKAVITDDGELRRENEFNRLARQGVLSDKHVWSMSHNGALYNEPFVIGRAGTVIVNAAGNNGLRHIGGVGLSNIRARTVALSTTWAYHDGSRWVREAYSDYGGDTVFAVPLGPTRRYVDSRCGIPIGQCTCAQVQRFGTSFASPVIAGLLSVGEGTALQRAHALIRSCHQWPSHEEELGFGVPDACNYLDRLDDIIFRREDFISTPKLRGGAPSLWVDPLIGTGKIVTAQIEVPIAPTMWGGTTWTQGAEWCSYNIEGRLALALADRDLCRRNLSRGTVGSGTDAVPVLLWDTCREVTQAEFDKATWFIHVYGHYGLHRVNAYYWRNGVVPLRGNCVYLQQGVCPP